MKAATHERWLVRCSPHSLRFSSEQSAPQSRTDPGHIPLSSCRTRHLFLHYHATIFSCIYPLGGQGRHVWQIVRQLPIKAGWWDTPLVLQDLAVSNLHYHYSEQSVCNFCNRCFLEKFLKVDASGKLLLNSPR